MASKASKTGKPSWIARLTFQGGTVATLLRDGAWKCNDRVISQMLDLRYDPRKATGVGVILPFGRYAASRAATDLKARVEFSEDMLPLPEDAIS